MRKISLLGCFLVSSLPAFAQTPEGSPPPTHEPPLSSTVGAGPLSGYENRAVRVHQLNVPVLVPLADLQAVLPNGYTALPVAAGGATAQVTLGFYYQQRSEFPAAVGSIPAGAYGPHSALNVFAVVAAPSGGSEQVILYSGRSTQSSADVTNLLFGGDVAQLAEVKAGLEEEDGAIKVKFGIKDDALGLSVAVAARVPSAFSARTVANPAPLGFRFLEGTRPTTRFLLANQADSITVPTAGNATVSATTLALPAGSLSIVGLGANLTFSRNLELFVKLQPGL
jgi:hypothetical protein